MWASRRGGDKAARRTVAADHPGATAGHPDSLDADDEPEGSSDPSVSHITSDLTYIRDHYGNDPSYLRIGGRFVVFVYADGADSCGMVDRWTQANAGIGAYLVLKVFPGDRPAPTNPRAGTSTGRRAPPTVNWVQLQHQPGFYKANEAAPRLTRVPSRWSADVQAMIGSNAPWQLITTFSDGARERPSRTRPMG